MGPAGQLWGPLVSSAFVHIRASLPKIIPAFECGSSISLGFGCLFRWTVSGELGWGPRVLTLFVREPRPEGTNHRPRGEFVQAWSLRSYHPIAKSLGFQNPKGDPRAEASNPESWTWEQLGDQAGTFL